MQEKTDQATLPPRTQAQQAYEQIEEMIITLELMPGSRISEAKMSQHLGLGRTPVREAMQRLASEGNLRILPRAGAIVSEVDVTDQFKLIAFRREVERFVTIQAARLADAPARASFTRLAGQFHAAAKTGRETLFIDADREFNLMIATTADNKYAATAMAQIQAQTRRFWYLTFDRFGELDQVSPAHARIAQAVAANDEQAAQRAFDALMDYVEEYTRRTVAALKR
ncbi:GntR family transcriptional regulator [Pontibaca salina]|uniref:GntR family transcriptional regulator n=1 Tax=Pontibaca salina TaxID=2795731 RepID=A0A934M133_9RHOB|nr:GntR family transcriptional regulator [Pontibaca salina]MBI6630625.1 GntR family transcriptional regulator [Pontibaca salina]